MRERLASSGRPATISTLWADTDAERVGAALEDLLSPPLFGGPQGLVIRRAEALRDSEQEAILARLPALGAGGTLILVAGKADPRRRLFGACARDRVAMAFPRVDERGAQAWVVRFARERGHDIVPDVEKVSLYAGTGARIQPAHVRAVVSAARAHQTYELTDCLAARDRAGAIRLLRTLLVEGEPPIRAAAFLAAHLRRALHVAELEGRGVAPETITAQLGISPWLLRKIGRRGDPRRLEAALGVLRRLDLELKSSRPADAVFEAALLEMTSR